MTLRLGMIMLFIIFLVILLKISYFKLLSIKYYNNIIVYLRKPQSPYIAIYTLGLYCAITFKHTDTKTICPRILIYFARLYRF